MSTLKLKPEKVKQIAEIHTLDESHRKIVNTFQKRKRLLPRKKNQLTKIKKQLGDLNEKPTSQYTNDDIKQKSKLKEDIQELKDEIHDIENNISEMEYYSKTDQVLMDYYDILDDKEEYYDEHPELSEAKVSGNNEHNLDQLDILNKMKKRKANPPKAPKKRKKRSIIDNKHNIMTYFNNAAGQQEDPTSDPKSDPKLDSKSDPKSDSPERVDLQSETKSEPGNVIDEQSNDVDRATLLDQYRMLTDNEYVADKNRNGNPIRICSVCNVEKTLHHSEATYTCMDCGEVEMIIIESEKPNYRDSSVPEKAGYPYKRVNHLSESYVNDLNIIMDIICV